MLSSQYTFEGYLPFLFSLWLLRRWNSFCMHQISLTQCSRNIDIFTLHSGSYLWIDACFIIALNNETFWIGTKDLNCSPVYFQLPLISLLNFLQADFEKAELPQHQCYPPKWFIQDKVRQSLHGNMTFHLFFSHCHKELHKERKVWAAQISCLGLQSLT